MSYFADHVRRKGRYTKPSYLQPALTLREMEESSERSMWAAVLTQMLMDATSQSRKDEARKAKLDAITWLTEANDDFVLVCEYAGYEPARVREKVNQVLMRQTILTPNGELAAALARPCARHSASPARMRHQARRPLSPRQSTQQHPTPAYEPHA